MKYTLRAICAMTLILLCADLYACLNLYAISESGRETVYNDYPPYQINVSPKKDMESLQYYEKWIKEAVGKPDYRYISNYAVYLIKLGRNKEALPIFKKLVSQKPGEYELLANLATAYELNGYPDSALVYMKRSLEINPHSHNSSEWFHMRFLEATLEHRDKKTSIDELNILKLGAIAECEAYEISHQLAERIPLTSAPNDMLAKVLEESADLFKSYISVDWSAKLYAMAIGFSANENAKIRLWQKLENARARVLQLNERNVKAAKRDEARRQLLSPNWKSFMQKDIDKWKAHRAHFENGIEVLDL